MTINKCMSTRDCLILGNDLLSQLQIEYQAWKFQVILHQEDYVYAVEFTHLDNEEVMGTIRFPVEWGRDEIIRSLDVVLYRLDMAVAVPRN